MAQLGGIAVLYERRDENIVALFRSVANFTMERTVDFGQRIDLFAEVGRIRGPFAEVQASASTGGEPVASANPSPSRCRGSSGNRSGSRFGLRDRTHQAGKYHN